ncbi:choline transporter-like 2 [Drosophila subpulchrella]|uniref:choline transporter-like 2 n=1 Tax=Drosophila subpulchrella TaxID=1486046 RepID=UPI0018A1847D|nr:choline transporter-like 2 [Drosophila subpulchrella]
MTELINHRRPRKRSFTDVPCLVVFLLFLGGWAYIAYYAITHGDLTPRDSFKRKCGQDSGVLDKKNLFYFDLNECFDPMVPLIGCPTPQECARWYIKSDPFLNRCIPQFSHHVCDYISGNVSSDASFKKKAFELIKFVYQAFSSDNSKQSEEETPIDQCKRRVNEIVLKEKIILTTERLGKMVGNLVSRIYTHDAQQFGRDIVEDVFHSWKIVLPACLCTLIILLADMVLVHRLSSVVLFAPFVGGLIGVGMAIYFTVSQYLYYKDHFKWEAPDYLPFSRYINLLRNRKTWLTLTIILGHCFLIFLVLVIALRNYIRKAITLTKEGRKAVSSVLSSVFFPILTWMLILVALGFAIIVGLNLTSIGDPSFRKMRQLTESGDVSPEDCICEGPAINYTVGGSCDPLVFQQKCSLWKDGKSLSRPCLKTTCSFEGINNPPMIKWLLFYNIFGFLWLCSFIFDFSYMVLASAFDIWYWGDATNNPLILIRAFGESTYHLGTVAFGSLVFKFVWIIRLVLGLIYKLLRNFDTVVTRAFHSCIVTISVLNPSAYIMCAISGKNLYKSGMVASKLQDSPLSAAIPRNGIATMFFLLSGLLFLGAEAATYYFLKHFPDFVQLHYDVVAIMVVGISTSLITITFFNVYLTAMDTMYLCCLEDFAENDGSPEKPYFMSKGLMKILHLKNKSVEEGQNH